MVAVMSQDTKDRIANLERQKIDLNNRIERLSYSGNHAKMLELEQEVWEIEDTISKLMPYNGRFCQVDRMVIHVIMNYYKGVEYV